MQLHLQVRPEEFANHWNAAQVLAGPQLALAANSPFLMGRRLWAETRIVLFTQSTDTRPIEYANQGIRPRVWFGERWITSIFDLFEENARWFPALLPEIEPEDPQQVLDAGGVPQLSEMRLHNGTIYRWNRPIYDVSDGMPHLRLENRVLPAGPTIVDTLANAAFAHAVEPGNVALAARRAQAQQQRAAGLPSLPSTLASELECNPFLRCDEATIAARFPGVTSRQAAKLLPACERLLALSTISSAPSLPIQAWLSESMMHTS
jgi:hypothetical protein